MTSPDPYRLSKSKIAAFEHCPLRLWLQVHHRAAGQFAPDTLTRFQFGHDVGRKARFLVPNGILVDDMPDVAAAIRRTAELLAQQPAQPIFEATFQREDVVVCVDIVEPDGAGAWRAIEVKAARRVKSYQLADLATQIWVMRGAGVQVSQAVIRHLANRVNWDRLDIGAVRFEDTDVTPRIERFIVRRPALIAAARDTVRGSLPHRPMGAHCTRPFACEFQRHCTDRQEAPLLTLNGGLDAKLS